MRPRCLRKRQPVRTRKSARRRSKALPPSELNGNGHAACTASGSMLIAKTIGLIACVICTAAAMAADAGSAAALRARYADQRAEIEKNQFGKPMRLQSSQTADR